jgi:hypothetical protein
MKFERTTMEWRFYDMFYFVCWTFRCKDMTPLIFSHIQQLHTTFTSQFCPEILI